MELVGPLPVTAANKDADKLVFIVDNLLVSNKECAEGTHPCETHCKQRSCAAVGREVRERNVPQRGTYTSHDVK